MHSRWLPSPRRIGRELCAPVGLAGLLSLTALCLSLVIGGPEGWGFAPNWLTDGPALLYLTYLFLGAEAILRFLPRSHPLRSANERLRPRLSRGGRTALRALWYALTMHGTLLLCYLVLIACNAIRMAAVHPAILLTPARAAASHGEFRDALLAQAVLQRDSETVYLLLRHGANPKVDADEANKIRSGTVSASSLFHGQELIFVAIQNRDNTDADLLTQFGADPFRSGRVPQFIVNGH